LTVNDVDNSSVRPGLRLYQHKRRMQEAKPGILCLNCIFHIFICDFT